VVSPPPQRDRAALHQHRPTSREPGDARRRGCPSLLSRADVTVRDLLLAAAPPAGAARSGPGLAAGLAVTRRRSPVQASASMRCRSPAPFRGSACVDRPAGHSGCPDRRTPSLRAPAASNLGADARGRSHRRSRTSYARAVEPVAGRPGASSCSDRRTSSQPARGRAVVVPMPSVVRAPAGVAGRSGPAASRSRDRPFVPPRSCRQSGLRRRRRRGLHSDRGRRRRLLTTCPLLPPVGPRRRRG
jgi:hypothetical protein